MGKEETDRPLRFGSLAERSLYNTTGDDAPGFDQSNTATPRSQYALLNQ